MRRRVAWSIAFLTVLLLAVHGDSAYGGNPRVTRLRVELSGSSDWQGVEIPDSWIAAIRVESISSGARISQTNDSITLVGGSTASAVLGVIVEVGENQDFTVALQKGRYGQAWARITRTNESPTVIADMTNRTSYGDYTTYRTVTRSQLVGEGLTIPLVDPRRLVLAFYYPWFQAGSFDQGPWYDTPIDGYDTQLASEVSKMVVQASQSGIDGFIVSWDDIGDHPARFDRVLEAARTRAFYVAPVIELGAYDDSYGNYNTVAIEASIKKVLQRATQAQFLTVAGRPAIFVAGAYDLGAPKWRTVVNNLAAAGHRPFFLGESGDTAYGFDGSFLYSPNHKDDSTLRNFYGSRVRSHRYPAMLDPAVPQRLWAATVSPGFNVSYFDKLRPRNEPRNEGARYDVTWGAALSSLPEWILVTSWNEWYEATHIQGSERFGYKALDQTRAWAGYFHNPQPAPAPTTEPPKRRLLQLPLGF